MQKIVLDTNVIVSALIQQKCYSALIVNDLALGSEWTGVMSYDFIKMVISMDILVGMKMDKKKVQIYKNEEIIMGKKWDENGNEIK